MKSSSTLLPGMLLVSLATNGSVDFNREVRPLLASNAAPAMGRMKRAEKPNCDWTQEDALKNDVIVPGEIENSEFHYRIHSDDPEEISAASPRIPCLPHQGREGITRSMD